MAGKSHRRSFLSAIAGALLIDPKKLISDKTIKRLVPRINSNPVYHPWIIWDSVKIVKNGTIKDSILFSGIAPDNFAIEAIGVYLPIELKVKECTKILNSYYLSLRNKKLIIYEGGLTPFINGGYKLGIPYTFNKSNNIILEIIKSSLDNKDIQLETDVRVTIYLHGFVEV